MISTKILNVEKQARSLRLQIAGKEITTPVYFPSISSVATRHNVGSLAELIIYSSYPYMLISAYDVFHKYSAGPELIKKINDYQKDGTLLLDSGGFECYWNKDNNWNFQAYTNVIKDTRCSIYTSFDPLHTTNNTSHADLLSNITNSAAVSSQGQFMPILHAMTPESLIQVLDEYLRKNPSASQFVAIPERECGVTISERARTILRARQLIDSRGNQQILHILGCGHPLSVMLYCFCGADSFDSRDWMRGTVDGWSLQLFESSHLELLRCNCKACNITSHPIAKVFLHNLETYMHLMNKIEMLVQEGRLRSFLEERFGSDTISKITSP